MSALFVKDCVLLFLLASFNHTEAFMRKILIGAVALTAITLAPTVQAEY
ncbi:Uncharacterised protein [Yersinia enterocolitica]|nr:Uncharacterised protein [Yersinia enterocolitica]